uniref:Uncharacterized protein n=1 Tax=Ditylenchus dipsaci TaxID=166011 RepID=A0A915E9V8_9BILA
MSVDQGVGKRRRSLWMGEAQRRLIIRLFSRKRKYISEEEVSDTAIGLLKEYLKWMEEGTIIVTYQQQILLD